MYTDYDVIYESNINEFIIPILIGLGILVLIVIISLVAMMRIFKKANRSGIAALVPVYNIIVMFEIVNRPIWQILLLFIPILNIIIYFDVLYKIAKSFRKTNTFALCTVFFPFIFLPIIGFSDSEYMGINNEAMAGNSVAVNILGMNESIQDNEPVIEKKETPLADISIGGGIYQKDYEDSLLTVSQSGIVNEEINGQETGSSIIYNESIASNISNKNSVKENFMRSSLNNFPIQNEEMNIELLNNIDFIDTTTKIETPIQQTEFNQLNPSVSNDLQPINPGVAPIQENMQQTVEIPTKSEFKLSSNLNESDYISCANCGAVVKKSAGRCFMCGKEI